MMNLTKIKTKTFQNIILRTFYAMLLALQTVATFSANHWQEKNQPSTSLHPFSRAQRWMHAIALRHNCYR